MDILGIGPLELFFIILIALIVLGPKDMVKAGRSIGRTMRKIVTSENWRTIQQASHEIRNIPTRLMREAGVEDAQKEITAMTNIDITTETKPKSTNIEPWKADLSEWTTPQNTIAPPISGISVLGQRTQSDIASVADESVNTSEIPPQNQATSESSLTDGSLVDASDTQEASEVTETD